MTFTGGFSGEESVREYFDPDDFDDVITVDYTMAETGQTVRTDIFCSEKVMNGQEAALEGTVRAAYFEVIVGKDQVPKPGGEDVFTVIDPNGTAFSIGDRVRIVDITEADGDTAMLIGDGI